MLRSVSRPESAIRTGSKNRGKRLSHQLSLQRGVRKSKAASRTMTSFSRVTIFSVATLGVAIVFASCILFYTSAVEDGTKDSPGSLRLVVAVFRHGERTPASTYPADPHINTDFFPMGWGALTNEGKLHQYEIGKILRERYRLFLSDIYSPKVVSARTTDVDRTKMSMQLVLAGLYPPSETQRWNKDLNWQPVTFQYEPLSEDKLLLVNIPCPRYYEALQEVIQRKEVKQQIEKNQAIYDLLTSKSGMEVNSFNDLLSMQGTLKAETDLNLTLPEWTKGVYPEPLNELAARTFTLNAYTPELRRIKGGPLLKEILGHFTDKANQTLHKKEQLYLYAGHDSTIAHLLNALDVWEENAPDYNSLIIIELHKLDDNSHGIKVLFRKSRNHDILTLRLPGCEELCSLDYVLENTKDVIPSDLMEHCTPIDPKYEPPKAPEI